MGLHGELREEVTTPWEGGGVYTVPGLMVEASPETMLMVGK